MEKATAIKIDNVSKTFILPLEKNNSIKSLVVNAFRKKNKSFEKQKALKNISFEIKEGEFFGIVGRNGSGKSTLLKMIAGIYSPSKGSIHINGKLTPFIELGVGFNPELTGRENVFLNGALLGFSRKEMKAMYGSIVEFAELERFMDQKLKNYSTGMQVRLAFSIAVRAKSDILLIDEVLAVGDISFQNKCLDYFEQLKDEGRTVVLVSHDMATVEKHCSRAILINKGVMVDEGEPKKISAQYRLLNVNKQSEIPEDVKPTNLSNDVKIKSITINGSEEAVVESNGELTLKVEYTTKKPNKYIISMSICRNDTHQHIAYFDTQEITKKTKALENDRWEAVCTFTAEQFLEGVYTVDIDIRDKDDIYIVTKEDAVNFSVESHDKGKAGLINIKAEWKVKKL